MKRPHDLRMLGKRLELVFDDLDIERREWKRDPPPSRSMKLEALDRLDRAATVARLQVIVPFVLAVSSVVTMVLAATLWSRDR